MDPQKTSSKQKPSTSSLLGPGLITGAADDDPSGIATYSQAGAQFGFGLLWTVFLTTPFMIAIQLVSANIGRTTGKGIAANAKALYGRNILFGLVVLLLIANIINIAADIAAMAEAAYLVVGGLRARARADLCGAVGAVAGFRALPALRSIPEMADAGAVSLCRCRFHRQNSVGPGGAWHLPAEDRMDLRLFPAAGGGFWHHDQPLSLLLASLAGSGGHEAPAPHASAQHADARWRQRSAAHENRYDRRHDLFERGRLFHHADDGRHAAHSGRHQYQHRRRCRAGPAAHRRRSGVYFVRAWHHRHRIAGDTGSGGVRGLCRGGAL